MDIEWQGKPINFRAFCREQKKLNKLVTGEQNQTRYAVLIDPDLADEFNSSKTDEERVPLVLLTQSMADNTLGIICLNERLEPSRMEGSGECLDCNPEQRNKLIKNLDRTLTRKRLMSVHPEFALARAIATQDTALCKSLLRDSPELLVITDKLLRLFGDYGMRLPQVLVRHCHEVGVELRHLMGFIGGCTVSDIKTRSITRGAFGLMSSSPKIDGEVRDILPDIIRSGKSHVFVYSLLKSGKYALVKDLLKEGWIFSGELTADLVFESGHKPLITDAVLKGMSQAPRNYLEASPEIIQWAVDSRWGKAFKLESELEEYWNGLEYGESNCGGNILAWAASVKRDEAGMKKLLRACAEVQGLGASPLFGEDSNQIRLLGIKKQVVEKLVGVIGDVAYLRWLYNEKLSRGVLLGCEALHVEMLSQLVEGESRREMVDALVKNLGFCFIHQPAEVRDDLSQRLSQMMPYDPGAVYEEMLRLIYKIENRPELHRQESEILLKYIDHRPEDGKKMQLMSGALGNLDDIRIHDLIGGREDDHLYDAGKLTEFFTGWQEPDDLLKIAKFLQEYDPPVFSSLLPMIFSEAHYSFEGWVNFRLVLSLVKAEEELSLLPAVMDDYQSILGNSFKGFASAIKDAGCETMLKRVIHDYRKENGAGTERTALSKIECLLEDAPVPTLS